MSALAPAPTNIDALLSEALRRKEILDRKVEELEDGVTTSDFLATRAPSTYGIAFAPETSAALLWQEWEVERRLLREQLRQELQASTDARNSVLKHLAEIDVGFREEDKREEELREKFAQQWAQEREAMIKEHESVFQGLRSAQSSLAAKVVQLEEKTKDVRTGSPVHTGAPVAASHMRSTDSPSGSGSPVAPTSRPLAEPPNLVFSSPRGHGHPESATVQPSSPCPRTPCLVTEPRQPPPRRGLDEWTQAVQQAEFVIHQIASQSEAIDNIYKAAPAMAPGSPSFSSQAEGIADVSLVAPVLSPRASAEGIADGSLIAPVLSPTSAGRASSALAAQVASDASASGHELHLKSEEGGQPAEPVRYDADIGVVDLQEATGPENEQPAEPVTCDADMGVGELQVATGPENVLPVEHPDCSVNTGLVGLSENEMTRESIADREERENAEREKAERERPLQVGFEVLKPVLEVIRWEDPNSLKGLFALQWNTKDGEHASIGRMELQVWDAEKESLLEQLQNLGNHAAPSSFQGMSLKGSLAAFCHGFKVRFSQAMDCSSSSMSSASSRSKASALQASQLLCQQILPAHIGCATSPAPITIDNLPMLTPLVLRLRLHSGVICGPWGEPLLLILLPDGDSTSCKVPHSDTLVCAMMLGLSSPVPEVIPGPIRVKAREGLLK